ncbi:MAG: FIST signal transduction protein [bacterium]
MKKLIFGIIAIAVFLFTIFTGIWAKERGRPVVSVGYGWSTEENERAAMKKAVSMVKKQLRGVKPEYVLLFSTVGYDSKKLLQEARRLFRDRVQIHGGTSCGAVFSPGGFHVGKSGSLALLAVASPKIIFGVGGASLEVARSAREAGTKAIMEAIENAGKKSGDRPKLVLMTAAPGREEEILLGIKDLIGKRVPVFGGSAGDDDGSGKWKEFANSRVYGNGVVLTAVYTDLKVGWAFESGYRIMEKSGIATKVKARIIYEIDRKPAAQVYDNWISGELTAVLKNEKGKVSIEAKTALYPLAKVIRGKTGEIYYISMHPTPFGSSKRFLEVHTNVKEGDEIFLIRGSWELLLNRARTTSLQATVRAGILPRHIAFGISFSCAGTMWAIPPEERPKIPLLVKDGLVGAPFIGTFTFGEQGFLPGVGNVHGNLVSAAVVFSNK